MKSRDRGLSNAQLVGIDKHGADVHHAVGIDCSRKLLFDPVETHALRLEHGNFDFLVSDDFRFTKVQEIFELVEQQKGRRSRKLGRTRNQASRGAQNEGKRLKKLEAKLNTSQ